MGSSFRKPRKSLVELLQELFLTEHENNYKKLGTNYDGFNTIRQTIISYLEDGEIDEIDGQSNNILIYATILGDQELIQLVKNRFEFENNLENNFLGYNACDLAVLCKLASKDHSIIEPFIKLPSYSYALAANRNLVQQQFITKLINQLTKIKINNFTASKIAENHLLLDGQELYNESHILLWDSKGLFDYEKAIKDNNNDFTLAALSLVKECFSEIAPKFWHKQIECLRQNYQNILDLCTKNLNIEFLGYIISYTKLEIEDLENTHYKLNLTRYQVAVNEIFENLKTQHTPKVKWNEFFAKITKFLDVEQRIFYQMSEEGVTKGVNGASSSNSRLEMSAFEREATAGTKKSLGHLVIGTNNTEFIIEFIDSANFNPADFFTDISPDTALDESDTAFDGAFEIEDSNFRLNILKGLYNKATTIPNSLYKDLITDTLKHSGSKLLYLATEQQDKNFIKKLLHDDIIEYNKQEFLDQLNELIRMNPKDNKDYVAIKTEILQSMLSAEESHEVSGHMPPPASNVAGSSSQSSKETIINQLLDHYHSGRGANSIASSSAPHLTDNFLMKKLVTNVINNRTIKPEQKDSATYKIINAKPELLKEKWGKSTILTYCASKKHNLVESIIEILKHPEHNNIDSRTLRDILIIIKDHNLLESLQDLLAHNIKWADEYHHKMNITRFTEDLVKLFEKSQSSESLEIFRAITSKLVEKIQELIHTPENEAVKNTLGQLINLLNQEKLVDDYDKIKEDLQQDLNLSGIGAWEPGTTTTYMTSAAGSDMSSMRSYRGQQHKSNPLNVSGISHKSAASSRDGEEKYAAHFLDILSEFSGPAGGPSVSGEGYDAVASSSDQPELTGANN